MNAFQQTAASAPLLAPLSAERQSKPIPGQLSSCGYCSGYSIASLNQRAQRLSCGHRSIASALGHRAIQRSNVVFKGAAGIDLPKQQQPLAVAPLARAGFPSPAADYIEDGIDLNEWMVSNPPATFFVRVSGDSMEDAGLFDNDVVAVDRSLTPVVRKVVVAVYEGAFYIKRLQRIDGRLALCSENYKRALEYAPMFLDRDPDHVVWGVVTGAVRKF